ncbi:hypothetical protein GCM10027517_30370 [Phycicoccus ginsengisoli]
MLIAEDLLLLLTEDQSGRLVTSPEHADAALAGAVLLELALAGRVGVTTGEGGGRAGRVTVLDPSGTGDDVLDRALAVLVTREGRRPAAVLRPLGSGLRDTLYERLARRGVVHSTEGRVLGVIPAHRWPAADTAHEADLRRDIADALAREEATDPRAGALVSLLHALRCEHKVVEPALLGLTRRELRGRAGRVATGGWASQAVRTAIQDIDAALAGVVAAVSGGSGAG